MKVLLINKFLYPKGGDAKSTLAAGKLLRERGHRVFYWGMKDPANPDFPCSEYFVDRIDYHGPSPVTVKISNALKIFYSFEAKRKIRRLVEVVNPDVVHLNNFAHQISPSILDVFHRRGLPAVMTMHDYKLVCPAYTMYSQGRPCEKCAQGNYIQCLVNRCVKGSYWKSFISAAELYLHFNFLNIYAKINVFISPSEFLKNKSREMGFKFDVVHLPNFIHAEEYLPRYRAREESICYVGRLSPEKGLLTLVEAVKGLEIELKIIGEGPSKESLSRYAGENQIDNVVFLGYRSGDALTEEIRNSLAVVVPSEWYENNPLSIIEAFALGKPVVGARIGGIPEMVRDGETGYTFTPGNSPELREAITRITRDRNRVVEMGRNARKFVEVNNNPEKYYHRLMEVYRTASNRARERKNR